MTKQEEIDLALKRRSILNTIPEISVLLESHVSTAFDKAAWQAEWDRAERLLRAHAVSWLKNLGDPIFCDPDKQIAACNGQMCKIYVLVPVIKGFPEEL